MILGIDHGYSSLKLYGDNIRRIFPSAVSTSNLISGLAHITVNGVNYCVGSGGTALATPDKINSIVNEVSTLTALAFYGSGEYYLVAGLPISQYKSQKDKFKEILLSYNDREVIYHGMKLDIQIEDVTIYPQGAAVMYLLNRMQGKYLIVDFGAYTLDVALIEMVNGVPTIPQHNTWFKGLSTIYSKIIDKVNNHHKVTLDDKEAENILIYECQRVDGENIDISFIDDIINDYLKEVFQLLDHNYKTRTTDIYICGGGANILYEKIKRKYPQVELIKDSQFANAAGYYEIGLQKYGGFDCE